MRLLHAVVSCKLEDRLRLLGGGTFGDWMEMDGEDLDVGLGWVCYASEF